MEDLKIYALIAAVTIMVIMLFCAICYGASYIYNSMDLKFKEKKIEMLQEKGILDENSLKLILEDL